MKAHRLALFCGAIVLSLASLASAQKTQEKLPPPTKPVPAISVDKVQVTSFLVNPTTPRQGESVTVKMTIKNLTGGPLPVPWRIKRGNEVLSFDTVTLAAGSSFDATATWEARFGPHTFSGEADPDNTLNEPQLARQNNSLPPFGVNVPPFVQRLSPGFFDNPLVREMVNIRASSFILQTGGNGSVFTPSQELKGFGVTEQKFILSQYKKEGDQLVGYNRRYDTIPCAAWLAHDPVGRKNQSCPYYRDDPIYTKFTLSMDLNDLRTDRSGVSAAFRGTQVIVAMRFEEDGKELTGSVVKKVVGNADLTLPVGAELSNTSMSLTFDLRVSNGQLDVQFSSLDFSTTLTLDVNGRQLPPELAAGFQSQLINSVKEQGTASIGSGGLARGLKEALNQLVKKQSLGQIQTITAIRAATDGGLEVDGHK